MIKNLGLSVEESIIKKFGQLVEMLKERREHNREERVSKTILIILFCASMIWSSKWRGSKKNWREEPNMILFWMSINKLTKLIRFLDQRMGRIQARTSWIYSQYHRKNSKWEKNDLNWAKAVNLDLGPTGFLIRIKQKKKCWNRSRIWDSEKNREIPRSSDFWPVSTNWKLRYWRN